MWPLCLLAIGLCLAPATTYAQRASENAVALARSAVAAGRRGEALAILEFRLVSDPRDTDARCLYGQVLSSVGREADARRELERVLAQAPAHADARLALATVELRSGRPDRVLELAAEALAVTPSDPRWRLHRARALVASGRLTEATETLAAILRDSPRDADARALRRAIDVRTQPWSLDLGHAADSFGDGRTGWQESSAAVGRSTAGGRVLGRVSQSTRGGLTDTQVEIEAHPEFRPGTRAVLNVGGSVDNLLYPHRRAGAEFYQMVGAHFEVSAGWRRLRFTSAPSPTTMWNGSLGVYLGGWQVLGRLALVPGEAANEVGYGARVRRAFGADGASYVGAGYGRGWPHEEIRIAGDLTAPDADTVRAEMDVRLSRHLRLALAGAVSREDEGASPFTQRTARASLSVGF